MSNELEVTTSVVEKKDSKSLAQEAVSADLVKTRPKIVRRKLGRPLKKDIEAKKN